jgi:hypothetical protein
MFKWTKLHGCNCTPLHNNGEKYLLNIGNIYIGIVKTTHNPFFEGDIGWSAEIQHDEKTITGKSGGGMTRDDGMAFVEQTIAEYVSQLLGVSAFGGREIYDSVVQTDPKTGEWKKVRLEPGQS